MAEKMFNELDYEQIVLGEKTTDSLIDSDLDKIRELKDSNEKILKEYPPEIMGKRIKDKIDNSNTITRGNFNYRKVYIPLSAAAVFLLFFTLLPFTGGNEILQSSTEESAEVIRLKGLSPSISIYRGNGNEAEQLHNNSLVRERDLLQISYDSAGAKYGVIFSIDGRGTVTLHYPDNVYSDTRLEYGGKVYLPYSYELDDAPFFERFFFVTSEHDIDAGEIMEKAGRIAKGNRSELLVLPNDQAQQSILLFKEEVE